MPNWVFAQLLAEQFHIGVSRDLGTGLTEMPVSRVGLASSPLAQVIAHVGAAFSLASLT